MRALLVTRYPKRFHIPRRMIVAQALGGDGYEVQEVVVSLDENKAVVRRLFDEVINAGRLDAVKDLFGPDHIHHFSHRQYHGPGGARDLFAGVRRTFPACQMTIDTLVAEGD